MIYTVAEISELVSLSKASIYNKLKTKDFKEYITKKQGVTYLDEIGLDLIKNDIKDFKDDINTLNEKEIDSTFNDEVVIDSEYINYLKEDINYLKEQNEKLWSELGVKDIQITSLNDRLATEQELTKNMQVLQLKQQTPQQDIKALEAHFENFDIKLLNIKEQMQERKKEQDQKPKGFLSKIFNKK